MMEAKYTFGTEPFTEWLSKNPDVEKLVLSGTMSQEDVEPFENALFKSDIKGLQLQDFSINDVKYEKYYSCPYIETVISMAVDSCCPISPFNKIIINADRIQSFVFEDGWIYSEDKKAVIHVPESVINYVHPKGVAYIGLHAFSGYDQLQSITFNDSLIEIGNYAFYECNQLSGLILPNSVTTLGDGAFRSSGIEKLTLSKNLQSIPYECFKYCYISELQIPSSVKRISEESFQCVLFDRIMIHNGVEEIGYNAFDNLDYICLPASLKSIASDFYYENGFGRRDYPPYVDVHPDNPIYYAEKGTLYYKADGKQVLDAPYRRIEQDEMDNE